MNGKRAFITGITGQDGSYMAEHLLDRGYEVYGLVRRRASGCELGNAYHLDGLPELRFLHGDMTDSGSLREAVKISRPTEVYHFAAQSHVGESFKLADLTLRTNALGTESLFQALSDLMRPEKPKVYNACTSEMFGLVDPRATPMLDEASPFAARSPYGISKIAQFHLGVQYRSQGLLRVWNGITFNHESERRGRDFVTRKITSYVARLEAAREARIEIPPLTLGNLFAVRDWGYAPEYCHAFFAMLNSPFSQTSPGSAYVIATGTQFTVNDLLHLAFKEIGIGNPDPFIRVVEFEKRPTDVEFLCGNPAKAYRDLAWKPTVFLPQIVARMVAHDRALVLATPTV